MSITHLRRRGPGVVARLGAAVAGLAGIATVTGSAGEWQVEYVTDSRWFAEMSPRSCVLDRSGHPRIAYGGSALYYAAYNGSEWRVQTVDPARGVGHYASLALAGTLELPRIAYHDAIRGSLKYAELLLNPPSLTPTWSIRSIDSAGNAGIGGCLALDANGTPHVSYIAGDSRTLRYAVREPWGWRTETIDDVGYGRDQTAIAITSAGHPAIAYAASRGVDRLRYARWNGGAWTIHPVPETLLVYSPSLVFHPDTGRVAIGFSGRAGRDLDYGVYVARTSNHNPELWWISPVSSGFVQSVSTSSTDEYGFPAIVSPRGTGGDLVWAKPYPDADLNLAWTHEVLDPGVRARYVSAARNTGPSRPRASYYDSVRGVLKYFGAGGAEIVDQAENAGRHASIAVDAAGHAHIAFFDGIAGVLRYARHDGAQWRVVTAASFAGGVTGLFPSLRLDSRGRPHILFYQPATGDLRYTWRGGTGGVQLWFTSTIAEVGTYWQYDDDVGGDIMDVCPRPAWLALDAAGYPHVSYAAKGGGLRYARQNEGAWVTESIDATVPRGTSNAIEVGPDGLPRVAFLEHGSNRRVALATRVCRPFCRWTIETVEVPETVYAGEEDVALALSPEGQPHLAWTQALEQVRYAWRDASGWHARTMIESDHLKFCSLATADGSLIHLTCFDWDKLALRYVAFRREGGLPAFIWTLDDAGSVGWHCRLALGPDGNPQIAYYDRTTGNLKRARYVTDTPAVFRIVSVSRTAGGAVTIRWQGAVQNVSVWQAASPGAKVWLRVADGLSGTQTTVPVDPAAPRLFFRLQTE